MFIPSTGQAYFTLSNGNLAASGSEPVTGTLYPASTLSKLTVYATGPAGITYTIRINGVNGNQTVTLPSSPAGLTGFFTDLTHTDSITANTTVNVITNVPGPNSQPPCISVLLGGSNTILSNDNTYAPYGPVGGANTLYLPFFGSNADMFSLTEANTQYKVRVPGRCSGLAIYLTTNSSGGATFRFRKNGINGSQIINIPGSVTGWFQDTSNTDSFAAGDLINAALTIPATGYVTIAKSQVYMGGGSGILGSSNYGGGSGLSYLELPFLLPLTGGMVYAGTEAVAQTLMNYNLKFQYLYVNVAANTLNQTCTLTLRKNSTNTALTVTIPAGTTGVFEDTSDTVNFISTDKFNFEITSSASAGSLQLYLAGVTIPQLTATVIGPIEVFPQIAL